VVITYFKGFKTGFVTEPFAKLEIRKPTNKLLVNVMNIKEAMLIHFHQLKIEPLHQHGATYPWRNSACEG
jgi:hypothetical protein